MPGSINLSGIKDPIDWQELFSIPKSFWQEEVADLEKYFSEQFGHDLPNAVIDELHNLKHRVEKM